MNTTTIVFFHTHSKNLKHFFIKVYFLIFEININNKKHRDFSVVGNHGWKINLFIISHARNTYCIFKAESL